MRRLFAVLPLAFLLAAPAVAGAQDTPPNGITTQGEAIVTAPNDIAHFAFRVSLTRDTPSAAQSAASRRIARVTAYIRGAGVAKEDVVTRGISLGRTTVRIRGTRDRRTVYRAIQSIAVTVRKIADAGKIVDVGVGAGATSVSGPTFDVSNRDQLYRQALRLALRRAQLKAQDLAEEEGLTLGKALRIVEGGGDRPSSNSADVLPEASTSPGAPAPTPIRPGNARIEASVEATFATS